VVIGDELDCVVETHGINKKPENWLGKQNSWLLI